MWVPVFSAHFGITRKRANAVIFERCSIMTCCISFLGQFHRMSYPDDINLRFVNFCFPFHHCPYLSSYYLSNACLILVLIYDTKCSSITYNSWFYIFTSNKFDNFLFSDIVSFFHNDTSQWNFSGTVIVNTNNTHCLYCRMGVDYFLYVSGRYLQLHTVLLALQIEMRCRFFAFGFDLYCI